MASPKVFRSTQGLIPIKEITDGMIITSDNRYVKILEVIPVNFMMKSISERNTISRLYKALFKSGPASFQIKSVSRKANMTKHMKRLKEEIMNDDSSRCNDMQIAYLKLLKSEAGRDGVSRRFFIAFQYERDTGAFHVPSREEIKEQLGQTAARMANALSECGNDVVVPMDETEQLEEIMFSVLNGETAQKKLYSDYKSEVEERYAGALDGRDGGKPFIPTLDLIAPMRVDFPSKDFCVANGRYITYAYIPSGGFNPNVVTGWLSPVVNSYEGVDLDVFFSRVPKEQVIFRIRQAINQNRALISDAHDTQASYEKLHDAIEAGLYLKKGLASGEDFYYMNILITIKGNSRNDIENKFNELKKMMLTMDITIRKCRWEMKDSYLSTLPLCRLSQGLYRKSRRNTLTSGASTTYPFTSFELMDENGILFGRNMMNSSLAIIDIFNTRNYKNANLFISGTTGAGKTFSLLLLATRMRSASHIPVIIIAPEKEHEFERVAQAIDGQFIRFGSGSPHCINIMDIFRTDDTVKTILDGGSIISSRLEEKVQDLKTFFKLLIPDISYEEKELLDEALMKTYYSKGITEDNESLKDPGDPEKYREMPVLSDLYDVLLTIPDLRRVANIVKVLVTGSGKSFNGHTNVNLDNEFVVLGLEHLSDDLLPVGMFLSITLAWSKVREDRTKRKALFIDEWWRFAFDPLAAEYSLKIAKTIRAYGGSLIIATQQMSDIFAVENGKYGEGVLNNCKIKIIMNLEEHDAAGVQRVLRLTDADKESITKFRQGEALLVANSNTVPIKFESNQTEFDLITTDRKALEAQVLLKMSEEDRERYLNKRKKKVMRVLESFDLSDNEEGIIENGEGLITDLDGTDLEDDGIIIIEK